MARPRNKRIIDSPPIMEGFKPFGIPLKNLEPVILLFEEFESIKLADYEGLIHKQAAVKMDISRATFTRIYQQARKKIAKAFIEGKAIFIEGGDFHTDEFWYRCESCKKLNISEKARTYCTYCESSEMRKIN